MSAKIIRLGVTFSYFLLLDSTKRVLYFKIQNLKLIFCCQPEESMLGEYPPAPPHIVLFAHCFESAVYSLMDTLTKIEKKSQQPAKLEQLGTLFTELMKKTEHRQRKWNSFFFLFFPSRSNCFMGQMLGRNCVSCYLGYSSEETKYFSLLRFQPTKQLKTFFLEKI